MAWVDMKDSSGIILRIPEPVYKAVYANNPAYTLVKSNTENSKQQIKEKENIATENTEGVEGNEQIQKLKRTQGKG